MHVLKTRISWLATAFFALFIFAAASYYTGLVQIVNFELSPKSQLLIRLSQINEDIKTVSAESSSTLVLRVSVRNKQGDPVPGARVSMSVTDRLGSFDPKNFRTDSRGEFLVTYIPPAIPGEQLGKDGKSVTLTGSIGNSDISSSLSVTLAKVPIIMVHGYQENAHVFDNMKEYFLQKGYAVSAIDYSSPTGVVASSNALKDFMSQQKKYYLSKGFYTGKFDLITHSMGGLIARYYSSSLDYLYREDINKLIFISVPHKGSPWASIGATYFTDQGISDLTPDNPLISQILPSMLNKGLNGSIQVGNIMVEYDEVVSPESASLSEWNIKTEVFNVGGSNFSMQNLLSGDLLNAPNHKNILSNKKAFEVVEGMLNTDLPYPAVKNR